jgi:hypothetical protein
LTTKGRKISGQEGDAEHHRSRRPRLGIEPFGKVWAVVEDGADGMKYGIYACGSKAQCKAWIREAK